MKFLIVVLLAAMGLFYTDFSYAINNSCVSCHSRLKNDGKKLINFKVHNWENSIHRKYGVTCNACHGGNPSSSTKSGAHNGVLPPGNPKSLVYYKNIPSTCGRCHKAELSAFKKSYHYQHLETIGNGPNCITCHSSMAVRILNPDNIISTCKNCHNYRFAIDPTVPARAKMALLMVGEGRLLINAYSKIYQNESNNAKTSKAISKAKGNFYKAIASWHEFNLDKISKLIGSMYDNLKSIK